MGNEKGTSVPNKKTIKKPVFFHELIKYLAICLIVSIIPVVIILNSRRLDVIYTESNAHFDNIENLAKFIRAYNNADDEDREKRYNELEYFAYSLAGSENSYYRIYSGDEKILETTPGYYSSIVLTEGNGVPEDTYYYLEDESYLAPLLEYKNGKYDHVSNADRKDKYSLYRYEEEFDLLIGDIPRIYDVNFQSVYINEETHTFLPGKVTLYHWYNSNDLDTIDCTPEDTKGYKYVEDNYDFDTETGYLINNPLLVYVEPTTENNENFKTYSEERTLDSDEDRAYYEWSIDVKTHDYYFSYFELLKVLPLTTIFVHAIAFIIALITALVISVIVYNKKKTTWEIFEYRKKTTAAMAHDLKTPLAAMAAYAENLEYDINSEKRAYYSSKIRENIDYMSKTVEGILDFSKSETGTLGLELSDINVHELMQNEVRSASELFGKNNISVDIKGEGNIRSNKELLEQAIRNLISNAAKYARPETTVNIAIDDSGFTVTNLTDQKIEDASKLKEPFVKGDESRGSTKGSGLGLSIADNSLASAGHKLDISVEGDVFKAVVRW